MRWSCVADGFGRPVLDSGEGPIAYPSPGTPIALIRFGFNAAATECFVLLVYAGTDLSSGKRHLLTRTGGSWSVVDFLLHDALCIAVCGIVTLAVDSCCDHPDGVDVAGTTE